MSSKLLNAAHRLLEDPSEEGNHIKVKDRACYTWLRDTPLKALHPRSRTICLGGPNSIALVTLIDDGAAVGDRDHKCVLETLTPSEHITAIQWACFAKPNASRDSKEESYLIIGTSTGHLQLHSSDAQLLHRQRLHAKAITAVTVRCAGMQAGSDDASEDITVCFEDAVARISSLELQSLTYLRKTVGNSVKWPYLGFNKWDTSRKSGRRQSAMCAGVQPPSLYASMNSSEFSHSLVLITVGRSPAIAAFTVSEHAAHGALQLISGLASSAVTGAAGLAKTALVGRQHGYRAGLRKWLTGQGVSMGSHPELSMPQQPEKEPKEEPPPPGEPATLWRCVKDEPRNITSLIAAPRGPLAAVSDSLGRVQILDTAAAAVVRILKGYRDARCAWVLLPASPTLSDCSERKHNAGEGGAPGAELQKPQSELEQASAANAEPSLRAGKLDPETWEREDDSSSQASSQDSFASAKDASSAPTDTDQEEQHDSASQASTAAQPGAGTSHEAAHDGAEGSVPAAFSEAQSGAGTSTNTAWDRSEENLTARASQKASRRLASHQAAGQRLLLAVHAPRRGVVDVWQAVHGPRMCSIKAGPDCCLLTVPPLLGLGNAAGTAAEAPQHDSYLFDCVSGQLQSLTEAVASAFTTLKPGVE